jgi:small nuclear ribonucleoprotein (snRNP)-like protein
MPGVGSTGGNIARVADEPLFRFSGGGGKSNPKIKIEETGNDLLSSNGKFKDATLQSKYDEYLERKLKAGETPKNPLEWKEASEKWASLREQGKVFSDESFSKFSQQYENAQKEITIVTNEGTKIRVDAIATDEHGNVIIQEYKSSDTAPYTPNQEKGFPEMDKSGGKIVGEGKGDFTEGYEIPSGTKVQTVRPDGTTYLDE